MDRDLSGFTQEKFDEAKENGTIKVLDVLAALADTDVSIEKLEKACEALEKHGIDVAAELANSVFDIT
ncbi:MAG: hypothetical protein IKM22_00470, partial [Clostridia bacterium]|nr:hypothetical protein [Clostridia bacterium]